MFAIIVYNILHQKPLLVSEALDLTKWNIFVRNSVKEYMRFITRELASRYSSENYQIFEYQPENIDITFNAHCKSNTKYCAIIITENDYKQSVAIEVLRKTLFNIEKSIHSDVIKDINVDCGLKELLAKYKTGEDKIDEIQKDLDETKEVMVQNVNKLLERGEKIEDLINKSEDLSYSSKAFSKRTKELNRWCCQII